MTVHGLERVVIDFLGGRSFFAACDNAQFRYVEPFGTVDVDDQWAGAREDEHEFLRFVARVDIAVDEPGRYVEEAAVLDLDAVASAGRLTGHVRGRASRPEPALAAPGNGMR